MNNIKLYTIEAGRFYIDGGAAFGVVPKKVWQKRYPCDEENFCPITMRCLLIDTGERKILIDAGTGSKQLEYLKYYNFEKVVEFQDALPTLGYQCTDITDVIFTHLHFDHCGGATRYKSGTKEVELVFPNATHWVGESQWKNFLQPNVREGNSYFSENMLPVEEAGKIRLVNKTTQICPEIEVRVFDGHTFGQLVSYVQTPKGTLVYTGDVIPLLPNMPVAWISSYDINPLIAMEEKKRLLDEAVEKKQILFFEHDVLNECCTVASNYKKHKPDKIFTIRDFLEQTES